MFPGFLANISDVKSYVVSRTPWPVKYRIAGIKGKSLNLAVWPQTERKKNIGEIFNLVVVPHSVICVSIVCTCIRERCHPLT